MSQLNADDNSSLKGEVMRLSVKIILAIAIVFSIGIYAFANEPAQPDENSDDPKYGTYPWFYIALDKTDNLRLGVEIYGFVKTILLRDGLMREERATFNKLVDDIEGDKRAHDLLAMEYNAQIEASGWPYTKIDEVPNNALGRKSRLLPRKINLYYPPKYSKTNFADGLGEFIWLEEARLDVYWKDLGIRSIEENLSDSFSTSKQQIEFLHRIKLWRNALAEAYNKQTEKTNWKFAQGRESEFSSLWKNRLLPRKLSLMP